MQLQLKTLLNHVHSFKGFVYEDVRLVRPEGKCTTHITAKIVPRKTSKPLCGSCEQPRVCYDHPPERSFLFVPLWGRMVYLLYAPRRVSRRREAAEHRRQGEDVTLKHTRWCLLKSVKNLTKKQYGRLKSLLSTIPLIRRILTKTL